MKYWTALIATLLPVLLLLAVTAGCSPGISPEEYGLEENAVNNREAENGVLLPGPLVEEGSAADALNRRVSVRSYSDEALEQSAVATLLWSAAGIRLDGETGATRTNPSAGGAYPLEAYLVAGDVEGVEAGVYRYDYNNHALQPLALGERRERLAEAALGQGFIAEAPAVVVLVAYYDRTTARYGERGERYVHIDAGHAAQSICLQAVELGLGTVVIGAFEDRVVAEILATDGEPLLILPLGVPAP